MMIQALIVDDEALARARVRKMLSGEPDVEVAGECASGGEAIAFIKSHRPDLIFLDIQMPEISGFDVLRALTPEQWPAVVFVTAHDRHALEAFDVHAVDYLLKPFKETRFREALQRVRGFLQAHDVAALNENLKQWLGASASGVAYPTRVSVKSGERTTFVRLNDVEFIEAAANYIILHSGQQNHIVRETLTNIEARLSPKQFLRVNRSAIVNLDYVKELRPTIRGEHVVFLKSGKELALTRGVREVQQRLEYL